MPETPQGVASILHRSTIAALVGTRTFDRGEQCFNEGRVLGVGSQPGELAGMVKPQEMSRAPYEIRIWVKDDGVAYACTCPVGLERRFCKHAVAVALAHLAKEHERHLTEIDGLKQKLMDVSLNTLLDGLIAHAKADDRVLAALQALSTPS